MVQTRSTTRKLIEIKNNGVEYNGFKIYPSEPDELEIIKKRIDEFMKMKEAPTSFCLKESTYTKAESSAFRELKSSTLCNLLDILLAKPKVQKILRDLPSQSHTSIQVAHRVTNLYVCLVQHYLDDVSITKLSLDKSSKMFDLFSKIIKYSDLILNCSFFNVKFLHAIKNKLMELIKYHNVLYAHLTFKHLFPEFHTDKIKPIYDKEVNFDGKTLEDYNNDPYYRSVLEKYDN
jgi:hypothetical protein